MLKPISWKDWFNRRADHYDNHLMKMSYHRDGVPYEINKIKRIADGVSKNLKLINNCKLLDVGSGTGVFYQNLRPLPNSITGMDISFNMIRDACKFKYNKTMVNGEASMLPFKSNSFDRIVCYSVFHYFDNLKYAENSINEFIRVINTNGLILIGDVPFDDVNNKSITTRIPNYYCPEFLKHSLNILTYNPDFFIKYGKKNKIKCHILEQNCNQHTLGRFDVLIEV